MTITIAINGEFLHHIEVTNRGPVVNGAVVDRDLRRYVWHCSNLPDGTLDHHRSDGAIALAAKVLTALQ